MTPLDSLRALFITKARPYNESRYDRYGIYHAHTRELLDHFPSRAAAEAAKTTRADHALRVRGVPQGTKLPKKKRKRKKASA